jgi:hypothetical protein
MWKMCCLAPNFDLDGHRPAKGASHGQDEVEEEAAAVPANWKVLDDDLGNECPQMRLPCPGEDGHGRRHYYCLRKCGHSPTMGICLNPAFCC